MCQRYKDTGGGLRSFCLEACLLLASETHLACGYFPTSLISHLSVLAGFSSTLRQRSVSLEFSNERRFHCLLPAGSTHSVGLWPAAAEGRCLEEPCLEVSALLSLPWNSQCLNKSSVFLFCTEFCHLLIVTGPASGISSTTENPITTLTDRLPRGSACLA